MPRPPSDRVEDGFLIWSTEGERNDTKTAELMGLAQTTISYWHRTYGWDERYLASIQPQAEIMAGVAVVAMRAGLPAVTQRLLHIATGKTPVYDQDGTPIGEVYASQDRDAIQAAKLLAQYGLDHTLTDGLPGSIDAQVYLPPREDQDLEALSVSALRTEVSRMIEATVQAVNTRPSRSRHRV